MESSSNNDFSAFSNEFHSISTEINELKKKAIENDFIMYGLSANIKTEDLRAIFDAVGAFLGENLMVVKSFAISSKKKRKCVVFGTFKDKQHKEKIFDLKKETLLDFHHSRARKSFLGNG